MQDYKTIANDFKDYVVQKYVSNTPLPEFMEVMAVIKASIDTIVTSIINRRIDRHEEEGVDKEALKKEFQEAFHEMVNNIHPTASYQDKETTHD